MKYTKLVISVVRGGGQDVEDPEPKAEKNEIRDRWHPESF